MLYKLHAFAAFAAALMMLSGCVLMDQDGHAIGAGDTLGQNALAVPKFVDKADLICKEMAGTRPCYCMTCTNQTRYNGTTLIGSLLNSFYDTTLVNGTCGVYSCNISDYNETVHDSKTQMRTFALGSGQSFVSGGMANLYCNYSLQMPVKWMKGGEGAPPAIPQASRAVCWLERSMLPVFIYYTDGKSIDPARTGKMAQAFNDAGVGPAIITTEAGWDGANTTAAALVKEQIKAIDSCDKCMTVLAVKPNDYQALYNTIGVPGGSIDQDVYDKIDAIGFGFRANDYPHCDINRIIFENVNFSRYILAKYNKPTIWLYVGASEGNSSIGDKSTGGCTWSASDVQQFYDELMARTGGLASSGVLGMSLYEFVDRSGPIPCNGVQGCDFGMLNASGGQKHPQLNVWSDMCKEVNMESLARKPLIFSKNGQGTVCDVTELRNDQALLHSAMRIASNQGQMMAEVARAEKNTSLGCGETCPGNGSSMPRRGTYDSAGNGFDPDHCLLYPIIDERADDADISATYMRAEFEQESSFDPFAVSNISNSSSSCNPDNLPIEKICEYAGVAPADCPAFTKDGKPCAYGLAQCIEYPGQYYVANGLPLPYAINGSCGGEKYNPFDPGMSACCGVRKFSYNLRESASSTEKFISGSWNDIKSKAEGGKCDGGLNSDEKGWAAYYLASNRYFGTDWKVLNEFLAQRDSNGDCTGTQHYIDYLRARIAQPAPGTNYGAQVMSRYRAAVLECGSECPR